MTRLAPLVGTCAMLLAATTGTASATTLDIYSSLPLQGYSALQTRSAVRGMRVAFAEVHGHAGAFDLKFTALDDSTADIGNWNPATTSENARKAADDPNTVLYLGEFNSGASAISIPILNQAGIPQISPSNTYNGLTTDEAGSCCGEPGRYYPTGRRTYFRLTPRDTVQSAALGTLMRRDGCRRIAIASDGDTYGTSITGGVWNQRRRLGLPIVSYMRNTNRVTAAKVAARAVAANSDCFFWGGVTNNHAPAIFRAVGKALPHAKLFGADGVCESGFGPQIKTVASRFRCTIAALPITKYPGGRRFLSAYHALYPGAYADPYAIFGYEAMKVGLDAIAGIGDTPDFKGAVLRALRNVRSRHSVLGTYSFDRHGDTTLRSYAVYRVTRKGLVVFDRAVHAL